MKLPFKCIAQANVSKDILTVCYFRLASKIKKYVLTSKTEKKSTLQYNEINYTYDLITS